MAKMMQVSLHEVFEILCKEIKRLKKASKEALKANDTIKVEKLNNQIDAVKSIGKQLEANFLFRQ